MYLRKAGCKQIISMKIFVMGQTIDMEFILHILLKKVDKAKETSKRAAGAIKSGARSASRSISRGMSAARSVLLFHKPVDSQLLKVVKPPAKLKTSRRLHQLESWG